ncbi:MAG TPA: serine hydrolase domain-containing protein [Elusimicrobiota bacterium]|nr:serine hydrolase domain-containing protein [Elusimicrobiota bacterium]
MTLPLEQRLRAYVDPWLKDFNVLGVAVHITGDRPLPLFAGFADPEKKRPLSVESAFPAYSASKSYIAAVVLRLAQDNLLGLDDPLRRWLPDLPFDKPVTLRQLLNHTSGLPDYRALNSHKAGMAQSPSAPWDEPRFLEAVFAEKFLFEPGTAWLYSGTGYLLLRKAAEAAARRPFSQLLSEQVLEPLRLRRTFLLNGPADMRRLTPGYARQFNPAGRPEDVRAVFHPGWIAHGVVGAPLEELNVFFDGLLNGRLLSPDFVSEMKKPVLIPFKHPFFASPGYGLGLRYYDDPRFGKIFGHGGEGPGFAGFSYYVEARKTLVSLYCNTDVRARFLEKLMFQLLSVLHDLL